MLTQEAMDDRAWCGLSTLRKILSAKRRDLEEGHYLTSASDSSVDHYRSYALLGELVIEYRALLAEALIAESASRDGYARVRAAAEDLDQLARALHSLAARLDSAASEVESIREHVTRATYDG